jgi:hypothetical protein
MNSDTAELAIVDPASELVAPFAGPANVTRSTEPAPGWWARLRADPARIAALRDSRRALWSSRLLVWVAGSGTLLAFGFGPVRKSFNPPGVTRGFGWLGDLLAGPAARWDASWFLVISHYGYRPDLGLFTSSRAAFFPLYPLGLRSIAWLGFPPVLAGVLLSSLALALALYGIHRLTTLELTRGERGARADTAVGVASPPAARRREALAGRRPRFAGGSSSARRVAPGEVARLAVMVTAFAPMAFFFSAIYSESLFLALSVGLFWCARQGRFAEVGVLGALAGATRSAGVVLALPAVILYLYGPREDRAPDFSRARRLAPRYRLRKDALWLGLLPAGLGLYMAYFALAGGDPLSPLRAQEVWGRHFAGPYVGVWDGIRAGFDGARQLLSFSSHHVYYPIAVGSPFIASGHNLLLLAFLIAAVAGVVGVLRMLPFAYGAYVIGALALPLSYPAGPQPLMSLPRFLVVLFPLNMWLAARLASRPRARGPVLAASALLMAAFVAQFATWHWVA